MNSRDLYLSDRYGNFTGMRRRTAKEMLERQARINKATEKRFRNFGKK